MSIGYKVFWQEFRENFHTTGAIAPSSTWAARELTRHVSSSASVAPRRILEVGPGTGAITRTLVRRLAPQDSLTLVELNERFVTHLRRRFEREVPFQAVADRTQIVHDRLENLSPDGKFNVIVSGLPLNNFSVPVVDEILRTLESLLVPGGRLSFFEYIAIREARSAVSRGAEQERLQGISRTLQELFQRHAYQREWILSNLPPIWVHHLQTAPTPCLPSLRSPVAAR